jgi:hypothetical protein
MSTRTRFAPDMIHPAMQPLELRWCSELDWEDDARTQRKGYFDVTFQPSDTNDVWGARQMTHNE